MQIDVAWNIQISFLVSDENDGGQSAWAHLIFPGSQSIKESTVLVVGISTTQSFSLFLVS